MTLLDLGLLETETSLDDAEHGWVVFLYVTYVENLLQVVKGITTSIAASDVADTSLWAEFDIAKVIRWKIRKVAAVNVSVKDDNEE